MDRQKYNSQALKEEFTDIYRDFFATCVTVVSAPADFMWAGNHSAIYGDFGITQNLPLRTYVGLEETAGEEIVIKQCLHFIPSQRRFVDFYIDESLKNNLLNFVQKQIKNLENIRKFKGLKIIILSEMPIGYGINASGALAAALVCAIFLHYKKITTDEISNWSKLDSKSLLANQNFDKLFRLIWRIELILHGGYASGIGAITPFFASRAPILYFTGEEFPEFKKSNPLSVVDSDDGPYNQINDAPYFAARLNELSKEQNFIFPFDFGLIKTETPPLSTMVFKTHKKEISSILGKTIDFINQNFISFLNENKILSKPIFCQYFTKQNKKYWQNVHLIMMSLFSFNIMKELIELNRYGFSTNSINLLIKNVNDYQNILKVMGVSTFCIDYLSHLLGREAKKMDDLYNIGLKSTSGGLGGYLVFVSSSRSLRNNICNTILQAKNENHEVSLDWLSWRDGLEDNGIIVEQSLVHKIYSQFITRGSVQILHLDRYGLHDDLYTLDELKF